MNAIVSRILGILIDNVIRAASESEEQLILLGIFNSKEGVNFVAENCFVANGMPLI